MSIEEFKEQEEYCKKNNTPEGVGCVGCPGEHGVCADNIRNLMGKLRVWNMNLKGINKTLEEHEKKLNLFKWNEKMEVEWKCQTIGLM